MSALKGLAARITIGATLGSGIGMQTERLPANRHRDLPEAMPAAMRRDPRPPPIKVQFNFRPSNISAGKTNSSSQENALTMVSYK
jgi:hypothetical protein